MAQAKYQILEEKSSLYSTADSDIEPDSEKTLKRKSLWIYILMVLLVLSGTFNLWHYVTSDQRQYRCSSYLVNKESAKDIVIKHLEGTLDDPDWDNPRYNSYLGMIAVGDDFVRENNLLPAQQYPWDGSKTMYYLNGFHSVHCVNVLRELLHQLQHGLHQTWSYEHATHCLLALREDAICHADDLPLYTGSLNAEVGHSPAVPGVGQVRKCRDWDRLHKFAVENTACFNPHRVSMNTSTLERYKSCPDGSRPWEKFQGAS